MLLLLVQVLSVEQGLRKPDENLGPEMNGGKKENIYPCTGVGPGYEAI